MQLGVDSLQPRIATIAQSPRATPGSSFRPLYLSSWSGLSCRRLFGSGQLAGSDQPPPVLRAPGGDPCPGEWPRWRPRGESAPLSARTGTGRHCGGSDSMGVCTMEDERNWFVGVDSAVLLL